MSKVLQATCDAQGVVKVAGTTVPNALVLSEGKQASQGALFLNGEEKSYLPSSASDIKTVIEKLSSSLEKIANILTSIGAGMTGATTAPPPTLVTDVAEVTAIKAELDALKDALK